MHTIITETECDSLVELEASFERFAKDPEQQAFMAKREKVIESQENELYTPLP